MQGLCIVKWLAHSTLVYSAVSAARITNGDNDWLLKPVKFCSYAATNMLYKNNSNNNHYREKGLYEREI